MVLQCTAFIIGLSIMAMIISSLVFFKMKKKYSLINRLLAFMAANFSLLTVLILITKTMFSVNSKHFILGMLTVLIGSLIVYLFTSPIKNLPYGVELPIANLAKNTQMGAGFNILLGISLGKLCTFLVVLTLVLIIILSFWLTGFVWHGIDFAFGAISLAPLIMAIDTFGPIADNAGGLVESVEEEIKSHVPRNITDNLDRFGNSTKAITKVLSYLLLTMVLIPCFIDKIIVFNLLAIISALIGSTSIFLFSALSINIVLNVSAKIVHLVREIFQNNPKVLSGEEEPDYVMLISSLTNKVLAVAHIPIYAIVLLSIIFVAIFFSIFNQSLNVNIASWTATNMELLEGFLPSSIALFQIMFAFTGIIMGMYMSISGGAWDNCKKFIETGQYGGKKSPTHGNAIIGDLVGDIFKDTTGPAIAPLILTVYCLTEVLSIFMHKFLFII
jgi:K(+)-stimulated pyrophosphate-energized sodium pump